jgi:transposase
MSIFRTLKQRGHDPIQTVVQAIEHYLAHNQLPPLPASKPASDG